MLRTDFSAKGFGYVICQPGTDAASEQAMAAFLAGHNYTFMTKESSAVLRPVACGGRRRRGNETRLTWEKASQAIGLSTRIDTIFLVHGLSGSLIVMR